MRNSLLIGCAALVIGAASFFAPAADPIERPFPTTKPGDAAAASGFIDDFLAGKDAAILEHASPRLKAVLAQTKLADVRAKTVGQTGAAEGADKVFITVVRRVVGDDGKPYEVVASVVDGHLVSLLIRPAE